MSNTILVVEDNEENRKLLVRYLGAKGYQVVAAGSTADADQLLASEQPRLVLVDISLPDEDGLTWVRRVRGAGGAQASFVALTAHSLPTDRARAIDAGCDEFMTKPVQLRELQQLVERRLAA